MGGVSSRKAELVMCTDGLSTDTSEKQLATEADCLRFYGPEESLSSTTKAQLRVGGMVAVDDDEEQDGDTDRPLRPLVLRAKTVDYLRKGLMHPLGSTYTSLDASRPWLIYWMLHALVLLDAYPDDLVVNIRDGLKPCLVEGGFGFGGGFMQEGHTAPTYAAVLAICSLGDEESFQMINRQAIYQFFMSLKDPCGGFRVQKDGEMDTRGLYTVLAVSSILNILTPELTKNCAEFVQACQTYEGGFGGEPGNEAHGGYSFCALAALAILDRFDAMDVDRFTSWLVECQMRLEGGFQGRSNKLVDSCYSFWQGATPSILAKYLNIRLSEDQLKEFPGEGDLIHAQLRLQHYIVLCCQFHEGGLRDKPEKHRDQYHTCYSLSGLSCSQQNGKVVFGDASNALKETDPVYNVETERLARARAYFAAQPPIVESKK